ncbi:MAG TPA: phosphate ABC transporter substrate-binding protein PstS [Oleiagrimonas sp.]|nr:phosphate ABC transporter substrate-binding protein PstS [Oleiagrimonas sp.]
MSKPFTTRLAVAIAASVFCMSASATDVTGAGSSFVYPVMSKWSATYAAKTGDHINYQSIGSSGGIAQIKAGTVDFGASDKPMSAQNLDKYGMGQFPIVIGGIVPILNVEGMQPGELVLDGPTLAKIFLGEITRWNDAAIARLNPSVTLPDQRIIVVHRSDGSGTSFNFTNYLSKVSPAWKSSVGEGTAVDWPTGIGGKGNEGVAAYVKQMDGAIGYVEYAYALTNHIAWSKLKNAAGKVVDPGAGSFQAAAATADWASAKDFNLIMTNAKGARAWPITATTWVIMPKQSTHEKRSDAALDFFEWSLENGQQQAAALDYVPLPDSLVKRIEKYWDKQFEN